LDLYWNKIKEVLKYIHKHNFALSSLIREIVFGLEDGMVSTLGAITGIAIGSRDRFTVLLAGIVFISVESISMGIGSYLSNKTSKEVDDKNVEEEKEALKKDLPGEKYSELVELFSRDGWPPYLSSQMAKFASSNNKLLLMEHELRELGISPLVKQNPIKNAIFMFISYNFGGFIPLISYFCFPISVAVTVSIVTTLMSLFLLGVGTSRFTKTNWIKSGFRTLILGGIALVVGVMIGELVSEFNYLIK